MIRLSGQESDEVDLTRSKDKVERERALMKLKERVHSLSLLTLSLAYGRKEVALETSGDDNYDDFLGYEAFSVNSIYQEDGIPIRLFQVLP